MPTISVTVQVTVIVADLEAATIGEVMCNAASGIMEATKAEAATIVKVETFEN